VTPSNLQARPAEPSDAPAIALIYNQGIEDRIATFETEPRTPEQVEAWWAHNLPIVAVTDGAGGPVVGYAAVFPYADRCCYRGIGEFSVYVRRDWRGRGVGRVAMEQLIVAAESAGLWKLLSRVFPENRASLSLMARLGFKEVGVHEKHGKLDGVWRDCVLVERLLPADL